MAGSVSEGFTIVKDGKPWRAYTSFHSLLFHGNGEFVPDTRVDGVWIAPFDCIVKAVWVNVGERGTSDGGTTDTIWDVMRNGATLYTTPGNRPTIASSGGGGESTNQATQPDVVGISAGDRVSVDTVQSANGTTKPKDFTLMVVVEY